MEVKITKTVELSENLWVVVNGPTAAELGEAICFDAGLPITLRPLTWRPESSKYVANTTIPDMTLTLHSVMADNGTADDEFPVSVYGHNVGLFTIENRECDAVSLVYNAERRVGLLFSCRRHGHDWSKEQIQIKRLMFDWPGDCPTSDVEERLRQDFLSVVYSL